MLDIYELQVLEERLQDYFAKNIVECLCKLNRNEDLETWLELAGLDYMIQPENAYRPYRTGKIVVVGESMASEDALLAVAKKLGFEKGRFVFYLSYEDLKSKSFKHLQYNPQYSLILVGPTPHKGKAMAGGYSSIIDSFENQDGYPPVIRMGSNNLKITKTGFSEKLSYALEEKLVM